MKQEEIKKLTKEQLTEKLKEFKKKLEDLKMTHSISPLENPIQIKSTRRILAKLKTASSNQDI
jgi:large subunit ribosomal protein L29